MFNSLLLKYTNKYELFSNNLHPRCWYHGYEIKLIGNDICRLIQIFKNFLFVMYVFVNGPCSWNRGKRHTSSIISKDPNEAVSLVFSFDELSVHSVWNPSRYCWSISINCLRIACNCLLAWNFEVIFCGYLLFYMELKEKYTLSVLVRRLNNTGCRACYIIF